MSKIGLQSDALLKSQADASGNTLPGPILLGAVARATATLIVPITCAKANVAHTCRRESVYGIERFSNTLWHVKAFYRPEVESFRDRHLGPHLGRPTTAIATYPDTAQLYLPRECTRLGRTCPRASGTNAAPQGRPRRPVAAKCASSRSESTR